MMIHKNANVSLQLYPINSSFFFWQHRPIRRRLVYGQPIKISNLERYYNISLQLTAYISLTWSQWLTFLSRDAVTKSCSIP